MKIIVQKAVVKVVRPQIAEYRCDWCGEQCGTRANPKETWYGSGKESHYCKKTCSPALHENRKPERNKDNGNES